jgi:hypothetical protein
MVKVASPDDPCYVVVNDAFKVNGAATWRLWMTAEDVKVNGQAALLVGKEDVDMDIIFLNPEAVPLKTEAKTRRCGSGMSPKWQWGPMETTQIGLIAAMPHTAGYTALLYPRLKTAKSPTVTPLAGGKGVKIAHEAGVDYVFLSNTPFTYDEGDIHFEGMAGMIQLRGKEVLVAMGSGGKVSARGKTAVSDAPLPKVSANIFPNNGDFENGALAPLTAGTNGTVTAALYKGNPVAGDTTHKGQYSVAYTVKEKGNGVFHGNYLIPVDPQRVYRISMNVYADAAIMGQFGGYGINKVTQNVKTKDDRVWGWSVWMKGPTDGWQALETTIGPEGSGAKHIWPPGIELTHMVIRIGGEPGAFYVDDISVEPQ